MKGTELLKQNGIIQSPLRVEVLNILNSTNKPLSQKEIENKIEKSHDRVSLYRTLKLFVKKDLVHRIYISENLVAFRIKTSDSELEKEHLHFHCNDCNRVFCMPQLPVKEYSLPKGFKPENINLVVNGTCENCNK